MSFTTPLKENHPKRLINSFYSIKTKLINLYKISKCKRKVKKMKLKLKTHGVSYEKKILFNDTNNKILFIHIPKAAGMSVVKTL